MVTKYQQMLALVHALEDKYGSVIKAPNSDPDLRQLRKIYPENNTKRRDWNQIRSRIYSLVQAGYSISKTANKLNISDAFVSKYIRDNGLQLKQTFEYMILASDVRYYVSSLMYFAKIEFHKSVQSTTEAKIYLQEHGFNIKPGYYVWADIPKGAYFLLNYMDVPKVKKRMNDYIYPPREAIQWKF